MKECPRCHRNTLHDDDILNALSHRDKKTYICNGCGDTEALIDYGLLKPGKMERDFAAALGKQGVRYMEQQKTKGLDKG